MTPKEALTELAMEAHCNGNDWDGFVVPRMKLILEAIGEGEDEGKATQSGG